MPDVYTKLSWDYIDPLNLTTTSIERFAQDINLRVQRLPKMSYMEDKVSLPLFAPSFYAYINHNKEIPSPNDFIKYYSDKHKKKLSGFNSEQTIGLNARLTRTYASVFRDFHFYHYLRETNYFTRVLYVTKYDIEQKVDVFVHKNRKWYGLQLFVNSARSNKYYNKKPSRMSGRGTIKAQLVPLPITFGKHTHKVKTQGEDLYLYGDNEFHALQSGLG